MQRRDLRSPILPVLLLAALALAQAPAWGQNPLKKIVEDATKPAAKPADAKADAEKKEPRLDLPKTPAAPTVATPVGPIKVDNTVSDDAVQQTLETLLPRYPGVRSMDAAVKEGVVQLDGQVDDDDTRDQMSDVVKQVEGVRMVINRLSTDAETMTAPELVIDKLHEIWAVAAHNWLLALLAFGLFLIWAFLAKLFNRNSEFLLAPFVTNVMLRSVIGSVVGTILLVCGFLLALSVLNLTHAVLSILGIAGLVGLAVGFAFKDIAENFIASVLLGLRPPFRVGDYISTAGQTGFVRSLNTRATILVTLEGFHVRIPNNIIYKEILINMTGSVSVRSTFDAVISYDASTAAAVEAVARAVRAVEGILGEPAPRTLVEGLEPAGVRLRIYYWAPVKGVDWFKLNSDAKLGAKVALQQVKAIGPPPVVAAAAAAIPLGGVDGASRAVEQTAQARANLRKDTKAAAAEAKAPVDPGQVTPMEHVLSESGSRASDEGANLLQDAKTPEPAHPSPTASATALAPVPDSAVSASASSSSASSSSASSS